MSKGMQQDNIKQLTGERIFHEKKYVLAMGLPGNGTGLWMLRAADGWTGESQNRLQSGAHHPSLPGALLEHPGGEVQSLVGDMSFDLSQ